MHNTRPDSARNKIGNVYPSQLSYKLYISIRGGGISKGVGTTYKLLSSTSASRRSNSCWGGECHTTQHEHDIRTSGPRGYYESEECRRDDKKGVVVDEAKRMLVGDI